MPPSVAERDPKRGNWSQRIALARRRAAAVNRRDGTADEKRGLVVRTSTAETHNYRCPWCGDGLKRDNSNRGWVAHVSNPHCQFEKGQKDDVGSGSLLAGELTRTSAPEHQLTDGVRVRGYSERGIFNALLYEIGFSADPLGSLADLLSLIHLPGASRNFSRLEGAEVLMEQSLSDFGDADAILLLHGPDWRSVVFIEGKVKLSQSGRWTTHGEWRRFLAREDGKLDSSNLFTQLYHKVRFISVLRRDGFAALERGVPFPACSTKTVRKLGANPVVLRAARMIQEYVGDPLYIAVVPDSVTNLASFYGSELATGPGDDVSGWDLSGWGYLSWAQIEEYCQRHGFVNTQRVFDFNRGQIY